MAQRRLKYSEFWDRINVDSFEEAIEWTPEYSHNDNDIGFCPFPENHSHGDTTGKFAIQREKRVYNCWVCGGGSLLLLDRELTRGVSMGVVFREWTEPDIVVVMGVFRGPLDCLFEGIDVDPVPKL
jgi:hypothetical protein